MSESNTAVATIIALERTALDRRGNGDPFGFLDISAPDVVYFDPYQEHRIDELDAVARYYQAIRGKVHIDRYELLDPNVQVCRDAAVLTFTCVSFCD